MRPLVFLPGAGGSAAFWRPAADRLADLGAARLLGWPGFAEVPAAPGVTSLDALYGWLLRELPRGPCHLVAQSMGGVLALRLALEHPDRVASLALVATSGGVDVAALGGADWRAEYVAELPAAPRWFVDDRTDLTARLGEVRAPALLVFGDADPVSPPAVGALLESRLPRARLVVFPGGTHALGHERPDELAPHLRAHALAAEPARRARAEHAPGASVFEGRAFRAVGLGVADRDRLQDLLVRCDEFHVLTQGLPARPDEAELLLAEGPPRYDERHVLGVVGEGDGARLDGVLEVVDGYPDAGVWWIGLLLLDPATRGRRLGEEVFRACEAWARARGARELQLAVVETNRRARAFWERMGFAVFREGRHEAPGGVYRSWVMRKPVGAATAATRPEIV